MQAHGVIGNQGANPVELEAVPSVSLTLAQMEGTEVSTFSITGPILPDAGALDHQSDIRLVLRQCCSSLHAMTYKTCF